MILRAFRAFPLKGKYRIHYRLPEWEHECACHYRSWRQYTVPATNLTTPITTYTHSLPSSSSSTTITNKKMKQSEEAIQNLLDVTERYSLSGSTLLKHMLDMVSDLRNNNVALSPIIYESLFHAYCKAGKRNKVIPLIQEMEDHGLTPSMDLIYKGLFWAARSSDGVLQAKLLDRMRIYGYERTPKTYNMIMNCISNNLEIERAFDTLDEMEALGITPQGSTYLYVAKLCLRMNEPVMVFDMLAKLESVGETTDPMWYMEALRCAVLCDDYTSVKNNWKRLILEQKQQPDDGLCKHALLVAARNHDPQLAYDIFSTVGQLGYPYTDHHFACLIDTFASTADYKNTFRIFTTMRKAGITPTKSTAAPVAQQLGTDTNAIICARQALEELAQEKDGVDPAAFNLIIHTFAYNGEFDQAMRTFDMAQQLGVTPDEDTLDALLDACIHQRSATRGEDLLDSFIRSGIQPTVVTLSKMVALMCTQDDYEDAFVYLEKIKKTGHVPLRGAYYRLIKKLSASNDPRLPMAIEDMEACGYSLSTHLDDYMDDKALLHEKRERKRLKEMAAEEFN